jgi:uncharacterized protein (TIGR00255 family)
VWEVDVQKIVQSRLKRGKITLSASLSGEKPTAERLLLDDAKLAFYMRTFKRIAKRYRLEGRIGIREAISLPNLFTVERKEISSRYWVDLKKAVQEALGKLNGMRLAEGWTIARDLTTRAGKISKSLSAIRKEAQKFPARYREQLSARIQALDERIKLDPDRLAREVAFQAERCDITEEIVRAVHHMESFVKSLGGNGETGKKLDFIVQEIQREVNTTASKAQNTRISDEVVRIKSELEKIREQIQNIV